MKVLFWNMNYKETLKIFMYFLSYEGLMRLSRTLIFRLNPTNRIINITIDQKLAKLKQKEQKSSSNARF